jgi:hypothetical protein
MVYIKLYGMHGHKAALLAGRLLIGELLKAV